MALPETSSQDRARQAAKITQNPQDYKVCEGCGSIVTARTVSCPNCHAYQFDAGHERVTRQAEILAQRDANSVLSSDLA